MTYVLAQIIGSEQIITSAQLITLAQLITSAQKSAQLIRVVNFSLHPPGILC